MSINLVKEKVMKFSNLIDSTINRKEKLENYREGFLSLIDSCNTEPELNKVMSDFHTTMKILGAQSYKDSLSFHVLGAARTEEEKSQALDQIVSNFSANISNVITLYSLSFIGAEEISKMIPVAKEVRESLVQNCSEEQGVRLAQALLNLSDYENVAKSMNEPKDLITKLFGSKRGFSKILSDPVAICFGWIPGKVKVD